MAASICWRCRPYCVSSFSTLCHFSSIRSPFGFQAPFSTSAVVRATPTKARTGAPATPKRGEKTTFRVKKKKPPPENRSRAPAPGERKAMRKRIVVSNTNALEVKEMQHLRADDLSDPTLIGKVLAIPGPVVDQLRTLEAFKPVQSWGLFRQPGTVSRSETLELGRDVTGISSGKGGDRAIRKILLGKRGSGKSIYLLQAMTMAFLKSWIVISIPDAQDLTNAQTEYGPIPGSTPTMYFQKTYTASLLARIAAANPQLSDLTVSQTHNLPIPLQSGLSLSRLCALGSSDPNLSYQIFNALIAELTAPGRPPLLLTLDGLQHIMTHSAYMSPSFSPIHAHDFHVPRWFLSQLSGQASLPNGGAVLAATTESNAPRVPTLEFRLKQLEAQQALAANTLGPQPDDPAMPFLLATGQEPSPIPRPDPYFKYDQRVLDVLSSRASGAYVTPRGAGADSDEWSPNNDIKVQRLNGLSKQEARGLMEYWALSGMFRHEVSERLVGEKWTVSGGGLVGELERGCLGTRV